MRCPDCGSGRREDDFNRNGWFWLECHRRYNLIHNAYSPENEHCRNIQLEERVRELEQILGWVHSPCRVDDHTTVTHCNGCEKLHQLEGICNEALKGE